MEIFGWAMALVIGLTLGMLGGGGSILTVPVFVYLFAIDPVISTGYSLFVVGLASLFGAITYWRQKLVNIRVALVFGIPSIAAVYLARKFLVPAIPVELLTIGGFHLTRSIAIMVLFSLLMIAASYSMIKGSAGSSNESEPQAQNHLMMFLEGIMVGSLSGLVGVGGGFLIIPALVHFSGLSMQMAVGTSLMIIAENSLIGFLGDVQSSTIDWPFLLGFAALAIVGIFIGTKLATRIPGEKLKPVFGWFILVMGLFILSKELLFQ